MTKKMALGVGTKDLEVLLDEDGTATLGLGCPHPDEQDWAQAEDLPAAELAQDLRRLAAFLDGGGVEKPAPLPSDLVKAAQKIALLWRMHACSTSRQDAGGERSFGALNDALEEFAEGCVAAGLIPDVKLAK